MIHVCSLADFLPEAERLRPDRVISLVDPETPVPPAPGVDRANHLTLEFHDIASPLAGYVPPGAGHIERLVGFGADCDGGTRTLIHCHAGVSRSTAAAFILMCQHNPGREEEAALIVRQRGPHARPNRRMVELADAHLGRRGALVAALEAMPPAPLLVFPRPMSLPARL